MLDILIYLLSHPYTDSFTKQLIVQLLQHLQDIPLLNADEMAEKCFVSPASLRKFVKNLGYSSYSEFKLIARQLIRTGNDPYGSFDRLSTETSFETQVQRTIDSLQLAAPQITDQQLFRVTTCLLGADKVFLCMNAPNHHCIQLISKLTLLGKQVCPLFLPDRFSDHIAELTEGSAAIFVRLSRLSEHFNTDDLNSTALHGAKSVLISNHSIPAISKLVDYSLCFAGTGTLYDAAVVDVILQNLNARLSSM